MIAVIRNQIQQEVEQDLGQEEEQRTAFLVLFFTCNENPPNVVVVVVVSIPRLRQVLVQHRLHSAVGFRTFQLPFRPKTPPYLRLPRVKDSEHQAQPL